MYVYFMVSMCGNTDKGEKRTSQAPFPSHLGTAHANIALASLPATNYAVSVNSVSDNPQEI